MRLKHLPKENRCILIFRKRDFASIGSVFTFFRYYPGFSTLARGIGGGLRSQKHV